MNVVFIFIDGLGIGEDDLSKNPCAQPGIKLFNFFVSDRFPRKILFDGIVKPIDARLGIPGLPQSATGQTALFTGINAAKLLDAHRSGFPNKTLRELLEQHSIHSTLKKLGKRPAFINVYRPIFFERGPDDLIRYLSVTSIANWKADLKFFELDHLRREQAIYHDFTNIDLIKKGFDLPEFSAEKAGQILARASQKYDFCVYEYFKTDQAGHAQNMDRAKNLLIQLERFILSFLNLIDLSTTLVILTSDHGNIEDISLKTHTKNPVPLVAWGIHKRKLLTKAESLVDVTPAIIKLFDKSP